MCNLWYHCYPTAHSTKCYCKHTTAELLWSTRHFSTPDCLMRSNKRLSTLSWKTNGMFCSDKPIVLNLLGFIFPKCFWKWSKTSVFPISWILLQCLIMTFWYHPPVSGLETPPSPLSAHFPQMENPIISPSILCERQPELDGVAVFDECCCVPAFP